jgi:hypothetical protein
MHKNFASFPIRIMYTTFDYTLIYRQGQDDGRAEDSRAEQSPAPTDFTGSSVGGALLHPIWILTLLKLAYGFYYSVAQRRSSILYKGII